MPPGLSSTQSSLVWALVSESSAYYFRAWFLLNTISLVCKTNMYDPVSRTRVVNEALLLFIAAPVLQGVRYWTTRVGNKTESLKYSLATCVLTAAHALIPAYFYKQSIYVLHIDVWVNILAYILLITELLLNVGSCLLFADIRTELSFLGLGLAPAVGLLSVGLVLLLG